MPDKIHKEKFSKLRDRIDYLKRGGKIQSLQNYL